MTLGSPRVRGVEVQVVTVDGDGSLDVFGRELARRLGVEELRTDVGRRSAEVFGVLLVSRASARALAADVAFVRRLRRGRGLLHLTSHHLARYGPFAARPYVVTVHDLIRQHDVWGGEPLISAPNARDRALLALDRRGIRRAAACIAVSDHTRTQVVEHLGVPADRVAVVYAGIDHDRFRPVAGRPLDDPYVLFVGSEQPRKDLPTLLAAFAVLKRDPAFGRLRLAKVGAAGHPEAPFRAPTLRAIDELRLERDVVLAGRVADDELPRWYSAAACLVLPSRHEGFGLPPVEAMACGCPVIVSSAGALPEVAGDAALVVPPRDPPALADAMRSVLSDPARAARLRRRGLRHAARFTWERAARETHAVYAAVAGAATAEPPPRAPAPSTGVLVSGLAQDSRPGSGRSPSRR